MKEAQGGENRKESEPADKPLKTARELEISLPAILFFKAYISDSVVKDTAEITENTENTENCIT